MAKSPADPKPPTVRVPMLHFRMPYLRRCATPAPMTQVWRILLAAMLCAVLGACDLETPKLASASVSLYQAGQALRSWQLSPAQVASVDAWLAKHRSGWNPDMATNVPRVLISAKGTDGSSWTINVLGTVVVIAGGRSQVKQSFSRDEIDALVAAIGVGT